MLVFCLNTKTYVQRVYTCVELVQYMYIHAVTMHFDGETLSTLIMIKVTPEHWLVFCLKCLMNTVPYEITLYQSQADFVLTDSIVLHILLVLILR